jgi:hypothetical protein
MVERRITPQKKSGIDWRLHCQCHFLRLVILQEKSGIGWRFHRHDHLFNRWLERMWDNKFKRWITRQNGSDVGRILHQHERYINQEELDCWETKEDSEPEGISYKDITSCTIAVAEKKWVRWPPLQSIQRNLGLRSIHLGLSIVWIPPAWLTIVGDMLPAWIAEASSSYPTWIE